MNHRQLEIFRTVMHAGSASKASELLEVTQPAVSRSIAELESSLGFLLFERIRGRLVPTPEAHLLMLEVDRSFVGMNRLRSEAARIRDFGSGSIRVASLAALGSTLVPRAIRRFHNKHPGIALTLQIHSTSAVREMVANGVFDLGLVADEADLEGVEHRPFGTFRAVCVMHKDHPLSAKAVIKAADFHKQLFIALAPEDRARQRLEAVLNANGIKPQVVVETPNSATICALALENVGIGLSNPAAADGFSERGLVMRPFEPVINFTSFIVFRPDAQKSWLVKAFTAALLQSLEAERPRRRGA